MDVLETKYPDQLYSWLLSDQNNLFEPYLISIFGYF